MNNSMLKYITVFFFLGMTILVIALVYSISTSDAVTPQKVYIEDQPLKILNKVDGVEGPALYMDERLQTSLYTCNRTDHIINVNSDGVFVKETAPPLLVVVDPTSVQRVPGCTTIIRMSPGPIASRGLSPGIWHIEGARAVKENTKELQRLQFKSESFRVLVR